MAAFLAGAFLAGASTSLAGVADTAGVGAGASAGAGAAGALAAASAFSLSPHSFLNRISTGSSTVEEGDLTNSPISLSFSRTNLLSTPYSLASSWTRVLATLERCSFWPESSLPGGSGCSGPIVVVLAHREVLIECS